MVLEEPVADRAWFLAAAWRLKAMSNELWKHVQLFYAELLRSEGRIAPEDDRQDKEYFRRKMAEARRRRIEEHRRRIAEIQAARSEPLLPTEPANLDEIPGLTTALDGLVDMMLPAELLGTFIKGGGFDLDRYQSHILTHVGKFEVAFDSISPLAVEIRKDRVYRFIALLFLTQAGRTVIRQREQDIMIRSHETDEQRQGVPRAVEEAA